MPDTDKALRQDVHQEPADELLGRNGHHPLHVSVSIVAPTERDAVAVECEQSMIGDGDAMGVTAEITQYLFGTTEGRLGVDDPFVAVQLSHERGEAVWSGQMLD